MKKIEIGKIVNVVGLKGEMKIYSYAENPDRFLEITGLFVANDFYGIEKVRNKGNTPIVKLKGIDTREKAESLKGVDVFMKEEELPPLKKGEFYVKDLLGSKVIEEEGGLLGVLSDIRKDTSQPLYCVEQENGKQLYIPGVKEFIKQIDENEKIIYVNLPKGLLEL